MSLTIDHIDLKNFRNHQHLLLEGFGTTNIIIGNNAVGKTNIIESIQMMTMLESFRNPQIQDLIAWGEDEAVVEMGFVDQGRIVDMKMILHEGKRNYYLNGKKKKINELKGMIPTVLFTPDDLDLMKGSSGKRRRELDLLGCQLSSTYDTIKEDYEKVVKQRNSLLHLEEFKGEQLESWNISLASLGSIFFLHRIHLFQKLLPFIKRSYLLLSKGEEVDVKYVPSWISYLDVDQEKEDYEKREVEGLFLLGLEKAYFDEVRRGLSLIGPQKDGIDFYIDGKDIRKFGSQGQQRTMTLALKIAEVELIKSIKGFIPLLLLDDVMSELDEKRRNMLFETISPETQTFITTTNSGYFSDDVLSLANIYRL